MDQSKTIKFKFHGKKEALKIVDTHGELSEYLSNQSIECPLMGSEIKIGKILGKGKFGAAFIVTIPEYGLKEYAVKRIDKDNSTIESKISGPLKKVAKKLSKEYAVSDTSIIALNEGRYQDDYIQKGDELYFPYYSKMCLTKENYVEDPCVEEGEKTLIPARSYICSDETYPEFVISSLCGNLFKNNVSANFFDIFGFATCPNKNMVSQYIFMEKIDMTLLELLENEKDNFEPWTIAVLMIQVIHAIGVYQKNYKIQHTDLAAKNIFIESIKPTTKFCGKNVQTAKYFNYVIKDESGDKSKDVSLYLPYIPWIVKIGDYGMAVKYSYPIVSSEDSIKGMADGDIPNWYTENYDILYFLGNMFYYGDDEFFYKLSTNIFDANNEEEVSKVFNDLFSESGRPGLWSLGSVFKDITPRKLLTNEKIIKEYLKPHKGAIFMGSF